VAFAVHPGEHEHEHDQGHDELDTDLRVVERFLPGTAFASRSPTIASPVTSWVSAPCRNPGRNRGERTTTR
jgi:hypothetical protein